MEIALVATIEAALADPVEDQELTLGYDQGRARAWLFEHKLGRRPNSPSKPATA